MNSLRLRLIPPEGEASDGTVYKNRRPTRVYVLAWTKMAMKPSVWAHSQIFRRVIIPIVYVEKWHATKDTARFALCVDEVAVHRGNSRPAAPQLRRIDGSDAPMVKRVRRDPEEEGGGAQLPAGAEAAAATAKTG